MPQSVDRLSALLERFRVHARLSFSGEMCGVHTFAKVENKAYLHVLRRGAMQVSHVKTKGVPARLTLNEPTLIFYPRPLTHHFHNAPRGGSDFTCAEIEFAGGWRHPLAQALPPLVILPLARVSGLNASLSLLFAETENVRCGHRVLADRLFEIVLIQLLRWLLDHPDEATIDEGLLAGLSSPQLARALTAIHEAPSDDWTVDRLADLSAMSRTAFATTFKKVVGKPPAQYVADWRLALVQARLKEGATLKALALDYGYSSQSALSRMFAQRLGMSPRAWLNADT